MGALTSRRSVALGSVPLDDFRTIRSAFETTINDVVLAASTAALRRWLLAQDAIPARPLVATVPISIRAPGDSESGNKVSMMRVHLPVGERDPVACLRTIHEETARLRAAHRSRGGNVFERFTELALNLTVPWMLSHGVALYARSGAANWVPAPWNIVISNVPGPPHNLYCAGARVTRIYPFGPVQHGSGLNLTVLSTREHMCVGALACSERVPELITITQGFVAAVDELLARARSDA